MKNTMKKIISLAVALIMLLAAIPLSNTPINLFSLEAEASTEDMWYYTISNEKATITGYVSKPYYADVIVIPDTLGGYPVVAIQNLHAYKNSNTLVLPHGLEKIEGFTFNSAAFKVIVLPCTLKSIGRTAFANCFSLEKVYYEGNDSQWQSVEKGFGAFYDYDGYIYLNSSVCKQYYDIYHGKFLKGYDESLDNYGFINQTSYISVEDYMENELFKPAKAKKLQKKDDGTGGQCYGMATSTAMFLNELPTINSVTTFFNDPFDKTTSKERADCIRSMNNGSTENFGDSYIGDFDMNLSKFISKTHIIQFKPSVQKVKENSNNDYYGIIEAVENYINGGEPVVIGIRGDTKSEEDTGHALLPVGIKKTNTLYTIYVNDSNTPGIISELKFYISDNTITGWSYNSIINDMDWGSDKPNGRIYFSYPVWEALLACLTKSDSPKSILNDTEETYNLLTINTDNCIIDESQYLLEILTENGATNSEYMYWVDSSLETLSISAGDEKLTFSLSDDYTSVSATIPEGSKSECFVDDDEFTNIGITDIVGKYVEISMLTANENDFINIAVTGTAIENEVTATQTETGIVVTGISDGTVTLNKNDEVVATQEIVCSDGTTEIIYDKNGENADLELDYDEEHAYTSVVTAPTCTEQGYTTYTCECGDTYVADYVDANGHTDSEWIIDKASTCSAEGSKHIECTVCEVILKTEATPKLPHNMGAYVVTKQASCIEKGTEKSTCSQCGYYTEKTIDKTQHNYQDGVCKVCHKTKVENCSHMCHKKGFMGFIWKIVRFFWKLFKMNPVCDCEVRHY